jgi:Caspase domain
LIAVLMDLQDPHSPHLPGLGHSRHRKGPGHAGHGSELISYEYEYVKLNSSLHLAWSESLAEDIFTNSTRYKAVEVLMLSWESKLDDLKVQGEIEDLKAVFEQQFHFHVSSRCLERVETRKTQLQINKIVADWVYEYDGPKSLLIVYFAGHGRPGKSGELEIAGHKSPSDLRSYLNKVVRNRTKTCLVGLASDVLQIFDCCFAGIVETRGSNSRASEFLAATAGDATTPKPGKSSFTTALIWALRELVNEKRRFSTSDLTSKITEAPDFPRDQKPILCKCGRSGFGEQQQLIVLEPLRDSALQSPTSRNISPPLQYDDSGHEVITLKFVFATRSEQSDIRNLGKDMNHVVARNNLKINRILFAGIQPKRNDMVFKAISRFRAMGRKFSGGGTNNAAASLIQNMENDIEEHVLDRINSHHDEGLEKSRREFEAYSSVARTRERED